MQQPALGLELSPNFCYWQDPSFSKRSSGGVVVKALACGAGGRGSIPGLVATISKIGYLLLSSRDMAERSLKRRKSSKITQPTN